MTKTMTTAPYASVLERFVASQLDYVLISLLPILLVAYYTFLRAGSMEELIIIAILHTLGALGSIIILALLNHVYGTTVWGGTLGKLITGLRVTTTTGELLTKTSAFYREWIFKAVSSGAFGLGLYAAIKHPEKQAWHDEMAGTYVVQKESALARGIVVLIGLLLLAGYLVMITMQTEMFSRLLQQSLGQF